MDREERKMAQIIASIERMEQQAPATKGKKAKSEGKSKARRVRTASSVASVDSTAAAAAAAAAAATTTTTETVFGRKLTPKKRWIQLWSAHLQDLVSEKEEIREGEDASDAAAKEASAGEPHDQAVKSPDGPAEGSGGAEKAEMAPAPAAAVTKEVDPAEGADTREDGELRVKTPQHAEASHLSPPVERDSSPSAVAASISPSAKVKEDESEPPSGVSSAEPVSEVKDASKASPTVSEEKRSGATTLAKTSSSGSLTSDPRDGSGEREGKKRSLERDPSSMTEEERRRAERRRKRKSNWDVGDPRLGGSPANSADGASPFGRFPPGRPTWRHSGSLDAKSFPPYRSSFNNNGGPPSAAPSGPRRGFYHSSSMPLDRSRSAGRTSRYGYGGGGSYR